MVSPSNTCRSPSYRVALSELPCSVRDAGFVLPRTKRYVFRLKIINGNVISRGREPGSSVCVGLRTGRLGFDLRQR
jgi:hypothetical protein